MSSLATTVSAMAAAGCSAQQIADVVAAHEAAENARRDEKRAKDAARKRRSRHAESHDVTRTSCDIDGQSVTDADIAGPHASATHAEPEPNKTTYPTTSEANASSVEPQPADLPLTGELFLPIAKPKPPPNAARGCRIPPGFPGDAERDWCKQNLGMTDDHCDECFAEFGDFWTGVPGVRGLKCDWPATLRNAARKFAARLGSRQAYPPRNQRSDGSMLAAHQRAAARARAANDVSRQRAGVFDHRERELEMHYGIPAE